MRMNSPSPLKWAAALALGFMLMASSERLWANEVVISGIGAAQFGSIYSTTNNSSVGPGLSAGSNGSQIQSGMMEFYVQNYIPAGSIINSVTLTMYVGQVAGSAGVPGGGDTVSRPISLYDMTAAWYETKTVNQIPVGTYNPMGGGGQGSAPNVGDTTWNYQQYATKTWTPGGSHVSTASATSIIPGGASAGTCAYASDGTLYPGCTGWTWSSAAMVADVQAWVNGTTPNYGWALINDFTENAATNGWQTGASGIRSFRQFYTNSGVLEGWEPALTVEYTAPVPEPASLALSGIGLLSLAAKWRKRFPWASKEKADHLG